MNSLWLWWVIASCNALFGFGAVILLLCFVFTIETKTIHQANERVYRNVIRCIHAVLIDTFFAIFNIRADSISIDLCDFWCQKTSNLMWSQRRNELITKTHMKYFQLRQRHGSIHSLWKTINKNYRWEATSCGATFAIASRWWKA